MQTYSDLQVILVNDGSTDESAAIGRSFVDSDSRFILLEQTNQGQAAARNRGLEVATGEYLVFVDADDYLEADFVEKHIAALGSADFVQSGYRRVLTDGTILEQKQPCHRYQFTSPCMRLYSMSLIRHYQLSFHEGMIYEDVIFSLQLWGTRPKIKMMDYCGYNYTLNPSSTTSNVHKTERELLFSKIKSIQVPWLLRCITQLRLFIHFALKK